LILFGTGTKGTDQVNSYNEAVGQRLRSIRKQRGLSLQEVQEVSDDEFKASVLGAYERGERALSLPRLARLARFFGVPAGHLLPPEKDAAGRAIDVMPSGGVSIDLNRVDVLEDDESDMMVEFLRAIQMMRQDFNGKVLTIRKDDLKILSLLMHKSEEAFSKELDELGVIG
jgi:transcriptional regulator with XRE-family HTH domain